MVEPLINQSTFKHLKLGFVINRIRYSVIKSKSDKANVKVFFQEIEELADGGRKFKRVIRKVHGVIYKCNEEGIVQEEIFRPLLIWNKKGRVELHTNQKDLIEAAIEIYLSLEKDEENRFL